MNNRVTDLIDFYDILDQLKYKVGSARKLKNCNGYMTWPNRGVYFFMEDGENRADSGEGLRVTRVGTHALKAKSKTKLWTRLSQHRGTVSSGGGNHRGSIFRLIVGTAILDKDGNTHPSWGRGSTASRQIRQGELSLETTVSDVIGKMPFLWLAIEDKAGAESLRGYIERNSIALLSHCCEPILDKPSKNWLGYWCNRQKVRQSGLWNQNHVSEIYDPIFLIKFRKLVEKMEVAQ